ncbi:MAG: coproporphyrinogen-III oxidase family protein, partial [bacterium]
YVNQFKCVEWQRRLCFRYYLSYASRSFEQMERYIDALVQELQMYSRRPNVRERKVRFVYFGGGTPSVLSGARIEKLLSGLERVLPWDEVKEVTYECSPKTVTREKMEVLRQAGVTRISLGVQQLNDEVLGKNGRVHLVKDVEFAYSTIRQVGFEVVNLDLMVGLLGETDTSFEKSLERTIAMAPDSVTIYQLEMPKNTPLYQKYSSDRLHESPASWQVKRQRLRRAFARLDAAGYPLRSAYTAVRNGRPRQFIYQDDQYHGADLLGLGASAFSYLGGIHFQNLTSLSSYLQCVTEARAPVERIYCLSGEEQLIREFILQLKLGRIERAYFLQKFSIDVFDRFAPELARVEAAGLLVRNEHGLELTPAGFLRVDEILPVFYLPEHQGVRYS